MTLREVNVIGYLCTKLKGTNPDAMGTSLEEDTFRKIPKDIPEMYVETTALQKLPWVIC